MNILREKIGWICAIAALIVAASFYHYWQTVHVTETVHSLPVQDVAPASTSQAGSAQSKTMVYISGAVHQPGVFPVQADWRVIDVINAAGGLTLEADVNKVNMANKIKDGMHIHVPDKKPVTASASARGQSVQAAHKTGPVNINTAGQEELQRLSGIGPTQAAAIIRYRQDNGLFRLKEEIKKVPGIGPAKYERLKNDIAL